MTGHGAATRARTTVGAALVTAVAVILTVLAGSPAPAATYAGELAVSLIGVYGTSTSHQVGIVPGVVSTTAGSPAFTFTAGCQLPGGADCASIGAPPTYHWTFGDGQRADTTANVASHAYTSTGTFTVSVTADVSTGAAATTGYSTGHGHITVAVATPMADVSAAPSTVTNAIRTVTGYGLLGPCRIYTPGVEAALDGSTSGQNEFCPQPSARTNPGAAHLHLWANPVTGANCLSSPDACGLPAAVFANHNNGDPASGCTSACQAHLRATGAIDADGAVPYNPLNCQTNLNEPRRPDSVSTVESGTVAEAGAVTGCMSYRDFLAALVVATDSDAAADAPAPAASATRTNLLPDPNLTSGVPGWTSTPGTTLTATGAGYGPAAGAVLAATSTPTGPVVASSPHVEATAGAVYTVSGSRTTSRSGGASTVGATFFSAGGAVLARQALSVPAGDTGWSTVSRQVIAPAGTASVAWTFTLVTPAAGDSATFSQPMISSGAQYGWISAPVSAVCADGPEPDAVVRRAHQLWGGAVRLCHTDAGLTKAEAYTLLAAATGTPAQTSTASDGLRDLVNPHLGSAADASVAALRATVGGVLAAGAPAVGDLRCPDAALRASAGAGAGVCFNGGTILTRADAAQLLAALVLDPRNNSGSVHVELAAAANPLRIGGSTDIAVVVTAPAYEPVGTAVTISAVAGSGDLDCPQPSATVDSNHQSRFTCQFTATTGYDGASLPVTVSATVDGHTSAGATAVGIINAPPVLGSATYSVGQRGEKVDSFTMTVPYTDPEGTAVAFGVRSCDPGAGPSETCASSGATFPQTGQARTVTADTNTTQFLPTATTDVGLVRITDVSATAVTVTFDGANYATGSWEFVLQACDAGGGCTHRGYTDVRTAVNDAPSATAVTSVQANHNNPVTVTLTGADPYDAGRGGYSGALDSYLITSLPSEGVLRVSDGAGGWLPAAVGTVTTDPAVSWLPAHNSPGPAFFTYKVHDTGMPAPGLWSLTPGTVTLSNVLPNGPPVAVLAVTPTSGAARATVVTADASASTPAGNASLTGYTIDWGDGTITGPTTTATFSHRYTNTTTVAYAVKLTVRDNRGATSEATVNFTSARNFVANATFESSTAGWSAAGAPNAGTPGTLALGTAGPQPDSTHSLMVGANSGGVCTVEDTPYSVKANSTAGPHTFTARVLGTAASVGKPVAMVVQELDAGGTPVGAQSSFTSTLTSSWTQLGGSYVLSNSANSIRTRIVVNATVSASTPCLGVDDVGIAR